MENNSLYSDQPLLDKASSIEAQLEKEAALSRLIEVTSPDSFLENFDKADLREKINVLSREIGRNTETKLLSSASSQALQGYLNAFQVRFLDLLEEEQARGGAGILEDYQDLRQELESKT